MKHFMDFIACGIIILLLALFCAAIEPIQLGGEASRMILNDVIVGKSSLTANETVSNSTQNQTVNSTQNQTVNSTQNQTVNATAEEIGDLWSWGSVPVGYALDEAGKLYRLPEEEEWVPSI